MGRKITLNDLNLAKHQARPFAAVTCYDYTTAALIAETAIEVIIVGDSAAQIMLGYDSTLPAKMDFMVTITAAVRKAAPDIFLIADMPFLSYQIDKKQAIRNAGRFIVQAGADQVKIEASHAQINTVKAVSDAGISVMAHLGMRPQSVSRLGKEALMAKGSTVETAVEMIDLAEKMQDHGASALLLEGTAREVAKVITQHAALPVLGCGSGPDCDGQVLVITDILGLSRTAKPKFSKTYADLASEVVKAVESYTAEVKSRAFPDDQHCYHILKDQREQFEKIFPHRK
ncbi:MAG: 3-methyl-2-oxobutanoate hydroxymethyltransferase [Planctomycetota bacterium]